MLQKPAKLRIIHGHRLGACCALLVLAAWQPAAAESRTAVSGHIAPQIRSATKLGRISATEPVSLSLVVRLNQALLDRTLAQIYGQGPGRGRYLSSAEFAQQFGLAEKRQKLKDFAQANGLVVDADDRPTSQVVKVSGAAGAVEQAFGIELNQYQMPSGEVFRAHETEPTIPASLTPHLAAVMGLSNVAGLRRPHVSFPSHPSATQAASSRPTALGGMTGPPNNGGMAPADIKTAYGLSGALNGSGQSVALFELSGYLPVSVNSFAAFASDIDLYTNQFGLPSAPLIYVGVDGARNVPDGFGGEVEADLDIEMIMALAPQVSRILTYNAPNTDQGAVDEYARIAADDAAPAVSSSWGTNEAAAGVATMNSENVIFQQMAVQGQTVYASAGDDGSNTNKVLDAVDDPASQPFVTGVGGTSLAGSLASLPLTESVWNNGGGVGGGGGVSIQWPLPSYQAGVSPAHDGVPAQFSLTHRNVPDVTLNADPDASPYSICADGSCGFLVGGTSAAAPLWAALTALINQSRAAKGSGPFGFANPTFYAMGTGAYTGAAYGTLFNDITLGNNAQGVSPCCNAGTGYDNASGWGSFQANNMIAAAFPAATAPSNLTLVQVNSSSITLSWTASVNNPELTDYRIDYWDYSVGATTTSVVTGTGTVFTVTGLVPNDTYFLSVGAIGSGGLVPPIPANVAGLLVSKVTPPSAGALTNVGPGGGTVSFNTGNPNNTLITLTMNGGAFPTPVNLTMSGVASGAIPGPSAAATTLLPTGFAAQVNLSPLLEPVQNVAITMTFQNAGVVGMNTSRFVVARYDTVDNTWVPLPSTVSGNTVYAVTPHLSLFQIMQSNPSSSVNSVKIFPNPLRPALGQTFMTFSNLPANARVRIYTLTGVLVQDLTADASGMTTWDGTTKYGNRAASGVYFVYAQDATDKGNATFKVGIER